MQKELRHLQNWLNNGHQAAIAIVKKTWGSAPRQIGSIMAIRDDELFEGSVSGGCVEASVIAEASDMLRVNKAVKTLTFSVADNDAWAVGLACGGEIEILIVVITQQNHRGIQDALKALSGRSYACLYIDLKTGGIISSKTKELSAKPDLPANLEGFFLLEIKPKPKLFIIGAVHIAQHLCVFAHENDYDVTVIDPREGFIQNREFKSAHGALEWPDDYFSNKKLDSHSAVIALTHDPKLDDPALIPALKNDVFYIGALGSKKTHAARINRMQDYGFSKDEISRIHGPIGLNIKAKTPAEIATSIMAEIIQTHRNITP